MTITQIVRILDGYLTTEIIIISYVLAFAFVLVLTYNVEITNRQLTRIAVFAAFQFFLQIIAIPIVGAPISISISGISLSLIVLGTRYGLISSLSAILLASILIPGYVSTLGVNSLNIIVGAFIGIYLPRKFVFRNFMEGSDKALVGFILTLLYQGVHGTAIFLEFAIAHTEIPKEVIGTILFIIFGITLVEAGLTSGIINYIRFVEREQQRGKDETFEHYKEVIEYTPTTESLEQEVENMILHAEEDSWRILDPRSKLIISGVLILSTAVSTHLYQLYLFGLLVIPVTLLYRPKRRFFTSLLVFIPVGFIIAGVINFFLGEIISSSIGLLIGSRFVISVAHSRLLLESEESVTRLIEALGTLAVPKIFISILLIAYRIFTRIIEDYQLLYNSVQSRGLDLSLTNYKNLTTFFRHHILIFRSILLRAIDYSEIFADSLTSRGFTGDFEVTLKPITKLGLTLLGAIIVVSIGNLLLPFYISGGYWSFN